jgi:hypothetical protein
LLSRSVFRVSPDLDARVQLIGDLVHHALQYKLLYYHDFWFQKHMCYLSAVQCSGASMTKLVGTYTPTFKNIVVMSHKGNDLINDLLETFDNLPKYKMMLKSTNLFFDVLAEKVLGSILSHSGKSRQLIGLGPRRRPW